MLGLALRRGVLQSRHLRRPSCGSLQFVNKAQPITRISRVLCRQQMVAHQRWMSTEIRGISGLRSRIQSALATVHMPTFVLGNASNVCFLIAYSVNDLLTLRTMAVIGTSLGIAYNYFQPSGILWVAVLWGGVFFLINGSKIVRLLLDANVTFTSEVNLTDLPCSWVIHSRLR